MTDDAYAEWDAAYVLGALGPEERREYERHLSGCPACRAAVTELAGMPAVLSELSAEQAVALTSPRDDDGGRQPAQVVPIASLASAARRDRRRRQAWQVAAAAALVAAGGLGSTALSHLGGEASADQVTTVELSPVGGSEVSADLTLTASTWGTSMEWSCSYPSVAGGPGPGYDVVYELVLVDVDGTRSVAGTWTGAGEDHASGLLASSAVPIDDIARVELSVGDGVVLAAADLSDA